MNQADADKVRRQIRKCLVEQFEYGKKKDGSPLKKPHKNKPIFVEENDFGTDTIVSLEEIMQKVDMALDFAINEEEGSSNSDWSPLV